MVNFREADEQEDKFLDHCGNITMAVLDINGISIPLCEECILELKEGIKNYDTKIFCYKCREYIQSTSGWRYGGSCKRKASLQGKEITENDAGYVFFQNNFDTCEYAILKHEIE